MIRFCFPGYGKSPTPTGAYPPHDLVRDLLDHLRIDKATLVGLSFGAGVAIDAAIAHPQRVERLVLAAPGWTARSCGSRGPGTC